MARAVGWSGGDVAGSAFIVVTRPRGRHGRRAASPQREGCMSPAPVGGDVMLSEQRACRSSRVGTGVLSTTQPGREMVEMPTQRPRVRRKPVRAGLGRLLDRVRRLDGAHGEPLESLLDVRERQWKRGDGARRGRALLEEPCRASKLKSTRGDVLGVLMRCDHDQDHRAAAARPPLGRHLISRLRRPKALSRISSGQDGRGPARHRLRRWRRSSRVSRSEPAWARASGSRRDFSSDATTVIASTTTITSSDVEVCTSGIASSCRCP